MANERRLISGAAYKKPWYGSYKSMMDRCYRQKSANYEQYGGRGISVCDEWHDMERFGEWAESNGFRKGLTIERENVNGNYCPENCRWATPKEQANNRRNTVFLEWRGERKSVHQWADELGVSASTLSNRYYLGWSVSEILETPTARKKPRRASVKCGEKREVE